jgi:alpha-ribazole phosphatase/probable phosphoglycerate mutase
MPVAELDALCPRHVEVPFPSGESYRERLMLVEAFLAQIRQEGLDGALLIVGHRATKWSLDALLDNKVLADIVTEPLGWRAYWRYALNN